MDVETLLERVQARYDGLALEDSWGEHALFYNPGGELPRGAYFLTVKTHDGENDCASALDRPDVYRVNLGVSTATYEAWFGPRPPRPENGDVVDTGHDFTRLDELLPHPVYAWAGWVCVLSPTEETLASLWPLVDEAYERALVRYRGRVEAP
jgi:hypothetical protein